MFANIIIYNDFSYFIRYISVIVLGCSSTVTTSDDIIYDITISFQSEYKNTDNGKFPNI